MDMNLVVVVVLGTNTAVSSAFFLFMIKSIVMLAERVTKIETKLNEPRRFRKK